MAQSIMDAERGERIAARLTSFAVAGTMTTAQEIIVAFLTAVPNSDSSVVAEETLSLVSVASARAVECGYAGDVGSVVSQTLINLPFSYHDYLFGAVILSEPGRSPTADAGVYERLERKKQFYAVHLAPGLLPTERTLTEKMELWMGRVSPPGLPEHPARRLERLSLVDNLSTHVKLVFEFARNEMSNVSTSS